MRGARYALPLLALSMCLPQRPAARRGQGALPLVAHGPTEWLKNGRGDGQQPRASAVVRFAPRTATARCHPVALHPERLFYSREEMGALKEADRADRRATGRRTLQLRRAWLKAQRRTVARGRTTTATRPTMSGTPREERPTTATCPPTLVTAARARGTTGRRPTMPGMAAPGHRTTATPRGFEPSTKS